MFATRWAPILTSSFEFGTGAFNAEVSFHLDEGSHDAEKTPAGQGMGIDLVGGGAEPDPRVLELVGERDQVFSLGPRRSSFQALEHLGGGDTLVARRSRTVGSVFSNTPGSKG